MRIIFDLITSEDCDQEKVINLLNSPFINAATESLHLFVYLIFFVGIKCVNRKSTVADDE